MNITGTFIDEITHDIPSANWGAKEWEQDFRAMKYIGIDTVIVIRNGYKNLATFNSKVLNRRGTMMTAPIDLLKLFLDLAEKYGMDLFFGTYDSGKYWINGQYQQEVDINKAFTEEVIDKYGHYKSFKGWYISHEIDSYNTSVMHVYRQLGDHLKNLKDVPILISPYIHGRKQFAKDAVTLAEHQKSWEQMFAEIKDCVDIVAFQDGNVDYSELYDYLEVNAGLARKYGLVSWTNIETFDRDMPIKFPPINWPGLHHKMQAAIQAKVDKMITFEFSHFMSPNSIYPAARNLYKRYCQRIGLPELNERNVFGKMQVRDVLQNKIKNTAGRAEAIM